MSKDDEAKRTLRAWKTGLPTQVEAEVSELVEVLWARTFGHGLLACEDRRRVRLGV